jgi:hypothetical protein
MRAVPHRYVVPKEEGVAVEPYSISHKRWAKATKLDPKQTDAAQRTLLSTTAGLSFRSPGSGPTARQWPPA